MTIIDIILILLIIIAISGAFHFRSNGIAAMKSLEERSLLLQRKETELADLRDRLSGTQTELARANERADSFRREALSADQERKRNEERFVQLAQSALGTQMQRLKSENETRLLELLVPFREQIAGFRSQVEHCYADESRERFALKAEIERLVKQSESVGREARELATALRGNSKTQGDWGEMILERLLEKSGLRKGEEFDVQITRDLSGNPLKGENGEGLRPDVVIYYPGKRAAVVDSKVSLTAFTEWINAEDEQARQSAGERHVESVRAHIAELRSKRYEDFVSERKLDFVMMFIPNESAYIAAMSIEPKLWQEAYDSKVLIVSPTHLVSVLRLVAQLWSHDRQTSNALKIAESAGNLYDKFAGFIEEMERIDKALGNATQAWQNAMKRLRDGRGNLMSRAEELRKLGVKTRKSLGMAETDTETDEDDTNQPLPAQEIN